MSRDALKKLEELSQMSQLYDAKNNLSQVLKSISNNRMIQQLRMHSNLAKTAAFGFGQDKIDSMAGHGMFNNIVNTSAYASMMGFPTSGSVTAAAMLEAQKRAVVAKQGSNKNGVINNYDTAAAGLNSMKNIGTTGRNLFYTNTALAGLAGATGHTGLQNFAQGGADVARGSFMMGPSGGGLIGSKLMGGVSGMGEITGGAMSKLLATAGIQGVSINPMMAGVATMMALSKGTSALHKMVNNKSSLGQNKSNRSISFHSKHPHQLEDEHGNVMLYQGLIAKMQSTGQIDVQTAILGQILTAIEGHTSVLPLIAAEIVNGEKRKDKQSNKSLNELEDKFGSDGKLSRHDQSKKNDPGFMFKWASRLEKFSSNFQSTFDIMSQLSNTLNGKSSTALANEAKEFGKTGDLLEAQKEFGRKYGVSTGMVQAIHTTPSQIMDQADTYEGRVISILGLISEINRFSAHELLQIRTKGFGLTSAESSSYLAKAQQKIEEERESEEGYNETYERWFKGIDEKLGLIPGWNVLSGSVKMINSGYDFLTKEDPKSKSMGQHFNDWILKGYENVNLGSEEQLKTAIGAKELSAEQRMATYLGFDYPNKFEELLDHIKRIDESTASMAGPVGRVGRVRETMNNFTGLMGDNSYHTEINSEILEKLNNEFNTLDGSNATLLQDLFGGSKKAQKQLKRSQRAKFMENNPNFLDDLKSGLYNDGGEKTESRNYSDGSSSLQEQQEQQSENIRIERQLSTSEQQLITLLEIRDILRDGKATDPNQLQRHRNGINKSYKDMLDKTSIDIPDVDIDLDRDRDRGRHSNQNRRNQTPDARRGRFSRLLDILGDLDNTTGNSQANRVARRRAAGMTARRLLTAGAATLLTGPIGWTIAAASLAYGAYELYDIINDRDEEKKAEAKKHAEEIRNSNARANYDNLKVEDKAKINDMVVLLEKMDFKTQYAEVIKFLESKTDEELLWIKSNLAKNLEETPNETLILKAINEVLDKRKKSQTQTRQNKNAFVLDASNANNLMGRSMNDTNLDKQRKEVQDKYLNTVDDENTSGKLAKMLTDMQNMNFTEQDYKNIATDSKSALLKSAAAKIVNDRGFNYFTGSSDKKSADKINEIAKLVSDGMSSESNIGLTSAAVKDYNGVSDFLKFTPENQKKLDTQQGKTALEALEKAFSNAVKNIDSYDKNGKAQYGLTSSEQQQIQLQIEELAKQTGINVSSQFNSMYQILAQNIQNTQLLAEATNKLAEEKKNSNSVLNNKVNSSND